MREVVSGGAGVACATRERRCTAVGSERTHQGSGSGVRTSGARTCDVARLAPTGTAASTVLQHKYVVSRIFSTSRLKTENQTRRGRDSRHERQERLERLWRVDLRVSCGCVVGRRGAGPVVGSAGILGATAIGGGGRRAGGGGAADLAVVLCVECACRAERSARAAAREIKKRSPDGDGATEIKVLANRKNTPKT